MDKERTLAERRHYRLGLLALSVEATVDFRRFSGWLPRTAGANDTPSAATLWVGGSDVRETLDGPARIVDGGVALWVDGAANRASLLCPAGHSELDLRERWGRVCPRAGMSDIGALLTTGVALLMGRVGAVLVDASAVVDTSGGGWLIVGPREDRSKLVRAFVRDGCDYISDDQAVLRGAHHQAGLLIVESWHRDGVADDNSLPAARWKPMVQLRGILLARTIVSRTPLPWRAASRTETLASLIDASPHVDSDPATSEPLRELLAACAARLTLAALLTRDGEVAPGGAVRALADAIDRAF